MTRQNSLFLCAMTLALLATPGFSYAQYRSPGAGQQRGAVTGGLAGAIAGGLIGDHNDEAGAGAAIGGVLGAVAGGIFGNAKDKENRYQREQRQYYQQQQQAVVAQTSVSVADVVSMSRSGLSETVIINQIQSRGVQSQPQVSDIIAMHGQGVSERVLSAMQQASTGSQRVARAAVPARAPVRRVYTPAPVYVEEHVVLPHYPAPHFYHHFDHGYHGGHHDLHHGGHHGSGIHIDF